MADDGLKPDLVTYKAMINAFIVAASYNDALDLVGSHAVLPPSS